ncbi:protein translocase subunit SecD [Clostridium thermosuccinogenes]|uniref:Protein translocase subunit SecD n=1 Tax=Clostridium thermosuccinogenes TaxID=84032 RepID=A0A2K2EZA9_9CLOT|nr:protein translocase subunit SecD [Pseudoclostridium thermosuccinogenes]AUS96283.1 protein translocase subunit SecD [Pseudoclostridium thermosuccinogenes]PNT91873.1 protein translocase subunit SecD [Pseudoclostridium thermosuccinogenes]PNT93044.1 protein translocase subunit SecD [Pseudoclostridium thermosuccinogenes]PNU00600.1 protein translocase subunit SecD [Pseudoclostridium thermosuccinogenes]
MSSKNGVKFFAVILIIGILTWITVTGDLFGIKIPGAKDIRFGIDINGGVDATLYAITQDGKVPSEKDLNAAKVVIERRLDNLNILDRDVTTDVESGSIILRIPWKQGETDFNPQKAISEIGATSLLTFQEVDESKVDEQGNYLPTGKIVIEGNDVVDTGVYTDPRTGQVQVTLKLSSEGAKKFAEATGRLIGKPIAIFMDDKPVLDSNGRVNSHAPIVSTQITNGEAVITGQRDAKEAGELAGIIKSGALPFKLEAKSTNSISPTLGKGALAVMLRAGAIAFVLVCLFMILYYRLPGALACIALLGQVVGQILAISWPGITLTLPGMAGVILSIGMGVDANIITSERIKEELKTGKTLKAAIDAGFDRAFSAVFDGNITVLISAIVLYIFGSGAMLSFAYSLGTGVLLNFLCGVTASRIMIKASSEAKFGKKHWLYGVKEVKEGA